ncbi:XRE family transcriptional regulator [Kribbella antibiotica]|uniref:XRE family transcriptional regulator n=1 Tax=Kribbella antibiotica TaxID=190195 RepID=A0A4R4YPN5_9ACTN|nr:helix-turn-helix transcriptional regulator [Kribbella antibiotica]TDD46244.1 XRE family transcriptional regulator [Kribbella antibiotica]
MTESGAQSGPTALRIILGGHLRRMRDAAGISRSDAGWEIRSSESKVSRMELGRVGFKERDVRDLLTLYGLDDSEERERLLALAREANNPGWWHRYGDVLPNWFQSYLGLESVAALIRSYELQFVPGLLQTPDYVRAVVQLGRGLTSAEEIERRVNLRISRQEVLTRPAPVRLWAVIDEAALRRPIGGAKTIMMQIDHLIEMSQLPNVTIQVMGFAAGGHAATGGAYSILRFPDADLADVVYIEHLTSALYLDKLEDLDQYTATMEALCVAAPPPNKTRDILADIRRDFDA